MTTTLWILTGYFFITILLYIIALIQNIPLMRKIASGFMLPNLGTVSIILLLRFLPDSFHILVVTGIVFSLVSISEIFFLFSENHFLQILTRITFILSQLLWLDIYKSTFYINRVPTWITSAAVIFYMIILGSFLFFNGKQSISKYCHYTFSIISSFAVNYSTFIMLCFESNLHTILQFAGSVTACSLVLFYILNQGTYNFKYKNSILLILLIVSQGLISAGNILMIG